MKNLLKFTLFVIFGIFSIQSFSQNPTISIQSTLKSISGEAVSDGEQSIKFKLKNEMDQEVWSETATVNVEGGIYSHQLGSVTELDPSDFGEQLYLEVEINNKVLGPSTKLGYSPYAMSVSSIAANNQSASFDGSILKVTDQMEVNSHIYGNNSLFIENHINTTNGGVAIKTPNNTSALDLSMKANNTGLNVLPGDATAPERINFHINNNSVPKMTFTNDSRLGIGTESPIVPLHIFGSPSDLVPNQGSPAFVKYFEQGGDNVFSTTEDVLVDVRAIFEGSTVATGRVYAGGVQVNSDERIKTKLSQSDAKNDLALLNKIQITEYEHIDAVNHDNRRQKKVIAQQIKNVLPEAVTKSKNLIPNVYAQAKTISISEGELKIELEKAHDFTVGDQIDLITPSKRMSRIEVAAVYDETTFSVKTKEEPEDVFVYGKYVDDFLTVDYDAISMLNVSASQEMYRMIVDLQKENSRLINENQTLRASTSDIEERISSLEALLTQKKNTENESSDIAEK